MSLASSFAVRRRVRSRLWAIKILWNEASAGPFCVVVTCEVQIKVHLMLVARHGAFRYGRSLEGKRERLSTTV